MLYADKLALHSNLANDMVGVRKRELEYLNMNVQNLAILGALLAGFAMAFIAGNACPISPHSLQLLTAEQALLWAQDFVAQAEWLVLVYELSTVLAIVCNLWVTLMCILSSILGYGLALRGPEGSLDKAVRGMAKETQRTVHVFFVGIVWFHVAMLAFCAINFHFVTGTVTIAMLIGSLVLLVRHLRYGLLPAFYVPVEQMVDGRFNEPRDEQLFATLPQMRQQQDRRARSQISRLTVVGSLLAGKEGDLPMPPSASASMSALTARPSSSWLMRLLVGRSGPRLRFRRRKPPVPEERTVSKPSEVSRDLVLRAQRPPIPRPLPPPPAGPHHSHQTAARKRTLGFLPASSSP